MPNLPMIPLQMHQKRYIRGKLLIPFCLKARGVYFSQAHILVEHFEPRLHSSSGSGRRHHTRILSIYATRAIRSNAARSPHAIGVSLMPSRGRSAASPSGRRPILLGGQARLKRQLSVPLLLLREHRSSIHTGRADVASQEGSRSAASC